MPRAHSSEQWGLLVPKGLVQSLLTCQFSMASIDWLASGCLLSQLLHANWLFALFLLACFFAPYFPSWKTGSYSKVNQVTEKTNYNTMKDEETHNRIFNTELDGTIFLCRVTSAALFQTQLDAGSGLRLPALKHWGSELPTSAKTSVTQPQLCYTKQLCGSAQGCNHLQFCQWHTSQAPNSTAMVSVCTELKNRLFLSAVNYQGYWKLLWCLKQSHSGNNPKKKKKKDWLTWAGTQCCLKSVVLHCFDTSKWETGHLNYYWI